MTTSIEDFKDCRRCGLYEFSRNNTPVFGKLTYGYRKLDVTEFSHYQILDTDDPEDVDILFLGEAPGKVEDTRGLPFIGPSGKLLEEMIAAAMELHDIPIVSMYITNIVACRPTDSLNGDNRPPTEEEVWACSERFQCELSMISPKYVVFLGETAANNGKKIFKSGVKMYHPAYILRQGGKSSSQFMQFARQLGEIIYACNQKEKFKDCTIQN